ncbi:MAG: hypothetical protein K0Q77_2579 [Anaerosporomusa subterranea]|jgi:Flp pilus assembly protein TadB|nr:hypothetical protein [Anaerosporomusa subterranea]
MEEKKTPSCHGNSGGSSMKHMAMMLVCCLVPLGLAFLLKGLGYSTIAGYMMLLLCPLMHIVMMKMMTKKDETKEEKAM